MEMMSPTRTSRPALASWPFTTTRPASQVSLAKLRRKITRLHFKNKSRRIRSILLAWGFLFRLRPIGLALRAASRSWYTASIKAARFRACAPRGGRIETAMAGTPTPRYQFLFSETFVFFAGWPRSAYPSATRTKPSVRNFVRYSRILGWTPCCHRTS